jgi:hypothetical protein
MDWADGRPPSQCRLPIDSELMLLVSRRRKPVIRDDSAIVAEFPSLEWDGPYRAVRFFLFEYFLNKQGLDTGSERRRKILQQAEAHMDLLSDAGKSIDTYLDDTEGEYVLLFDSRLGEWYRIKRSLRAAVTKIERLKKFTQDALTTHKKDGRPQNYSKSYFVRGLANLWRIMTGEVASKDMSASAPFASFISEAWASLGADLPEISWASQIRRREETLSAAELVSWFNQMREFPVKQFRFARKHGLHPELPLRFSSPGVIAAVREEEAKAAAEIARKRGIRNTRGQTGSDAG